MKKLLLILLSIFVVGSWIIACTPDDPVNGKDKASEEELSVKDKLNEQIIGIDAGAGIMSASENAIDVYDLDYELIRGSDTVMTAELQRAIENEEWIIVTGWTPHWKFAEWDLKFLEDPENIYGESETINALSRLDLHEDYPEVHQFLTDYYINDDQLGSIMTKIADGVDEAKAARDWMNDNSDVVEEWIPKGVDGQGETIKLAYVNWECSIASTHLVAEILEQKMNYEVVLTKAEVGLVYQDIAEGNQDAFVSAWLPVTHRNYYEEHKDNFDNLGPTYEGAKIGLVVPEYVDVDSISDLDSTTK